MITAKELIEMLENEDPEALVVQEGSSAEVTPYSGLVVGRYAAENTWSGEFTSDSDPDSDPTQGVKAVFLQGTS